MKKTIFLMVLCLMLFSNIAFGEIEHFYEIKLKYNYGKITYESLEVRLASAENQLKNQPGGFVAEVVSFDDEILNYTFFNIPLIILYDSIDEDTGEIAGGGMIELDEAERIIKVPYYEDAKEINIYNKDVVKKLTIDVSSYAKENLFEIEKESKIAEEGTFDETQKDLDGDKDNNLLLIIGIILVVVVFIVFRIIKHKSKI